MCGSIPQEIIAEGSIFGRSHVQTRIINKKRNLEEE